MTSRDAPTDSHHESATPWCATDHGHIQHPDDDDHRSEGRAVVVEARTPTGDVTATVVEIGLLRRQDDAQTWFVIEDGQHIHLELTLDSARQLLRAMREDKTLRTALDP